MGERGRALAAAALRRDALIAPSGCGRFPGRAAAAAAAARCKWSRVNSSRCHHAVAPVLLYKVEATHTHTHARAQAAGRRCVRSRGSAACFSCAGFQLCPYWATLAHLPVFFQHFQRCDQILLFQGVVFHFLEGETGAAGWPLFTFKALGP